MAKQTINVGSGPSVGDGEGLRDAMIKVNSNFDELYLGQDEKVDQGSITTSGLTTPGAGLLGRATGSTAAPIQNLTDVQAKTFLGLDEVDNTSDAAKPVSAATLAALNGKEDSILPGTNTQYWRGDKTWAELNRASVGLGSVDNTSDLSKPISTAVATALSSKADTSHTHVAADIALLGGPRLLGRSTSGAGPAGELTFTDVRSFLNISNVDNTSDAAKPVSTATQAALNLKLDTTGTIGISQVTGLQTALDAKAAANHTHVITDIAGLEAALDAKANINSIGISYSGAGPADSAEIHLTPATQAFTISVANSRVKATAPASASQIRDIVKNGTTIGTVTWSVGNDLGTIDIPIVGDRSIAYGDHLKITATGQPNWAADLAIILRN